MSGDYIMAVKSIGLSKVGGRKPCTLDSAAKHNKRELASELEARGRIDGDRVGLNYRIAGATDAAGVVALAARLMAIINTSPDKMRRDYCQAVEIVFSLPPTTTIDAAQYFADCVAWCRERFGADNILSADVHLDESAPHCHALIAPIHDGRWVGSSLIDRTNTQALRESFEREVAAVYGLRMMDRLTGRRKSDAVAMVLAHIEKHERAVIASPLWQPLRQAIERNPAPFVACLGLELTDRTPAKQKTMAQIFTSPGKGAKRETLHLPKPNPIGIAASAKPVNPIGIDRHLSVTKPATANPIGIENRAEKHQSLSCVGIGFSKQRIAAYSIADSSGLKDDGRTVERDLDASPPDLSDFDLPAFDHARVVTDDDGVIRERDHYQHQPDGYDLPTNLIH